MFNSKDQAKLKRLLDSCPESAATPPKAKKRQMTPKDRSEQLAANSRLRLSSARFRAINEFLYSHSSSEANDYLSEDLFSTYHKTYEELVKKWPKKPIDCVIQRLESIKKKNLKIADIGCGNRPQIKEAFPRLKVHSFDLVSSHSDITAADMTSLPLKDKSVDVCVYCLSLMATNLNDCLREANRVLSVDGTLIIAEVTSRFDPNEEQFVRQMRGLGFELRHKQHMTDFFLLMEFTKVGAPKKSLTLSLKPCVYKLR